MSLKTVICVFVPFSGLFWKSSFFGDALCLLEVTVFVDDDNSIGIHQAVSDRGGRR